MRLRFGIPAVVISALCVATWRVTALAEETFVRNFKLPNAPEPALTKILSTYEFRNALGESLAEKIAMLKAAFWRFILELFQAMPSLPRVDLSSGWTFLGSLALALLIVALIFLVWKIVKAVAARKRSQARPPAEPARMPPTSADLRNRAAEFAAQGDYSSAAVHLFRFLLVYLDEHGRISLHKVKTNREIIDALKNDTAARTALMQFAPIFNAVRYGGRPCDKAAYEKCLTYCRPILSPPSEA